MKKVAKITEKEEEWSFFFYQLVKEYVDSDFFLSMLGTLPERKDVFISLIKKALRTTKLEYEKDYFVIPKQWWALCNELKNNIVSGNKHSLGLVGDSVINSIREHLPKEKKKNTNPSKLWDKAQIKDNEHSEPVFTCIEINQGKAAFLPFVESSDTTPDTLGYLDSDISSRDLAVKLSFQLSAELVNLNHRDLVNLNHRDLVLAFEKYTFNENLVDIAEKNYERFLYDCKNLLKESSKKKTISKKIKEYIKEIIMHNFRGKSFPTFPGLISTGSITKFPNLHQSRYIPLFNFRVHGEGWDKNQNILPKLLQLNEQLDKWSKTQLDSNLKELSSKLRRYLKCLNIRICLEDLNSIYTKLHELIESRWVPEHTYRIKKEGIEYKKEFKLSPKTINTKKLIVFVHENIPAFKTKNTKEQQTSFWDQEYSKGIQDYICYLLINSEFFPKNIEIYHRFVKCDVQSRPKNYETFFIILKAVIDSAIIYLLMSNDPEIKKALKFLNHEFQHITNYTNVWFLPFTMIKDERNTLFHDYYYMLLKGVNAWEAKFFERKNHIEFTDSSDGSQSQKIGKIISLFWKNSGALNSYRRKLNVQLANTPKFEKWGEFRHSEGELGEHFTDIRDLYEFENAGLVKALYLETITKKRRLAIPSLFLERYMSTKEKWISQIPGMLCNHEWYYTAHSLKNTSTAGYLLRDFKTNKEVQTTDVILLSLGVEKLYHDKENNETKYLRHCTIYSHLSSQRELQILDEYFVDTFRGDVDEESHLLTATKAIAELSKLEIPIVMKIKHYSRTERSFLILDEAIQIELQKEDGTLERKNIDYDERIIDWVANVNKKRISPVFIFNEKSLITHPRVIEEKDSFQQISYLIEHPVLTRYSEHHKLIGLLVYGSRREEQLEIGKKIRKDLFPSFIFTVIPEKVESEKIFNILKKLVEVLPCYADEKGGTSTSSLKRMFNLPNPDSGRILNPSVFIKGANRLNYSLEEI